MGESQMDEKNNLIRLSPTEKTENKNSTDKGNVSKFIEKNKKEKDTSRTITSITSQKRKGRYNIFIDGEYAFPVDEAILIKHLLRKDMEISIDFQKQIEKEDGFYKAYQTALNYLSYALRSEKEVKDNLIEKEYDDYIESVIQKLKTQRLINDLEYAKSYVRTAANINRKGPRVISQELRKRGIEELQIEDALIEYPASQQIENVEALIKKKWKKSSKTSQRDKVKKVKAYLMQKGYSNDIIQEAFNHVDTEMDENEEYRSLVKQADKAWRRYSRKTDGFELIQKMKSFLYGKGYPSELINEYIEEKEKEE